MVMEGAIKLVKDYTSSREVINRKLSSEFNASLQLLLSKSENLSGSLPEDIDYSRVNIEGGDEYNFYAKLVGRFKNENWNVFDIFKCSVDFQLKKHRCYFVRTILHCANDKVKENYDFMISVYKKVLDNLKDGIELSQVYRTVESFAEQENTYLARHLEKKFGFTINSSFSEDSGVISAHEKATVRKDMAFAININMIGLVEGRKFYNLCYSDTVLIKKNGPPRVLTYLDQ